MNNKEIIELKNEELLESYKVVDEYIKELNEEIKKVTEDE